MAGACLVCIACLGAGVLAVWHYTDRHDLTIKGGAGAGLGALAGIVAAIVGSLLQFLLDALGLIPDWRTMMRQGLEESQMDPQQMDQIMEMVSSPLAMVAIILISLVIYAILGAVGGAIGASMFKRGPEGVEGYEETL